jgi:aminoglycoside phosphotransferase
LSSAPDYDDLARYLLDTDPAKASFGDWAVARVGRNPVWRIESRREILFVKIMKDPRYYARERHGLEKSQRLASQHDWITAPDLVHTNEDTGALVTTALPGVGVGGLLRSAFRMDRNPLRRSGPMEELLRALSFVLRWLGELHRLPVTSKNLLFDHSSTRIRERILVKLDRGVAHEVLAVDGAAQERLGQLEMPPSAPVHLICGDATLGNFLWDGRRGRIGRIDFEDIGFGSPARDFSEIREGLKTAGSKLWYWNVDQALAMVPSGGGPFDEGLCRLEWALDRHWPGGRRKPSRRMRRLERDIRAMLGAITR